MMTFEMLGMDLEHFVQRMKHKRLAYDQMGLIAI